MAYIILSLIVIVVGYIIISHNGYKKRLIKCDEAYAGIDVALSKRYNLITNLVETVMGYAKHEKEVLTLVTNLRNTDKTNLDNYSESLDNTKRQLFMLVESYPELKADTNFLHLQKSLSDVEEHLQAARRLYNRSVADYNTYIQMTPRNLIPIIKNASSKIYFQAHEDERGNIEIDF